MIYGHGRIADLQRQLAEAQETIADRNKSMTNLVTALELEQAKVAETQAERDSLQAVMGQVQFEADHACHTIVTAYGLVGVEKRAEQVVMKRRLDAILAQQPRVLAVVGGRWFPATEYEDASLHEDPWIDQFYGEERKDLIENSTQVTAIIIEKGAGDD